METYLSCQTDYLTRPLQYLVTRIVGIFDPWANTSLGHDYLAFAEYQMPVDFCDPEPRIC